MDATAITFCMDNVAADRGVRPAHTGQHPVPAGRSPRRYSGRVIDETLLDAIDKMEKAVEHVQGQFATVRTGRASPALVEKLLVDYYGSDVPLQQLAGFQVPEAAAPDREAPRPRRHGRDREGDPRQRPRASPRQRRRVIRLSFPPLTEERRKEYVKVVKHYGRGRAGGGAQHPPGRPQASRGSGEEPARSPPTSSSGPRRSSRRSPTSTWRRSTRRWLARSRSCSRC